MIQKIRSRFATSDGQRGELTVIMVVGILLTSYMFAMLVATRTQIRNGQLTRDYSWAEQMASAGIADALYQANEGKFTQKLSTGAASIAWPTKSVPRKSTDTDLRLDPGKANKDGLNGLGSWSWYVKTAPVQAAGGAEMTIVSTGVHNKRTRTTETTLHGLEVRSVSSPDGKNLTYTMSPRAAFGHAVFGSDSITNTLPTTTAIAGIVGTNGNSSTRKAPTLGTRLYDYNGPKADASRCLNPSGAVANCGNVTPVATSLGLDQSLAQSFRQYCTTSGGERSWTASSEESPRLVANNNTLCLQDLVIDKNTNIIGSGFLHIYVSGNLIIAPGASISSASATPVIYTNSTNVKIRGSETVSQKLAMYLYAPNATCALGETVSGAGASLAATPTKKQSRLEITGSVACKNVDINGAYKLTWKLFPPAPTITAGNASPGTDLIYNRRIWYASNTEERFQ